MSPPRRHKQPRRRPAQRRQVKPPRRKQRRRQALATDILVLSDGTVLAHNLTPVMASVLHQLNPQDESFRARAGRNRKQPR
jgi:hypothetical protein